VNYKVLEIIEARIQKEPVFEMLEEYKFMIELKIDDIFNEYKLVFSSTRFPISEENYPALNA